MPIGITDDHVELARRLREVGGLAGRDRGWPAPPRTTPPRRSPRSPRRSTRWGCSPSTADGGSLTRPRGRRRGVRRRAAAGAAARHRGRLRRPPRASAGRGRARRSTADVVHDAPACDPRPGRGRRRGAARAASSGVDLTPGASPDLTRRTSLGDLTGVEGTVVPDLTPARLRALVVTLAAAEASGVARWCLDDGGRVRQGARAVRPEDRRLPGDQAPVRRDARDRRGGHRGRVGRGVGRRTTRQPSRRSPRDVAGAICFDGAVAVAKACIQVLGGIGFTFEHDAHLYLRRALALRALVGDRGRGRRAADRPRRRRTYAGPCDIDLDGREEPVRAEVRADGRADRRAARGGAPGRAGRDAAT